jgi:hypothetical protein
VDFVSLCFIGFLTIGLLLGLLGFWITVWMAFYYYVFPFFANIAKAIYRSELLPSKLPSKQQMKPFTTFFVLGITIALAFIIIGITYGFNAHQSSNSAAKPPLGSHDKGAKVKAISPSNQPSICARYELVVDTAPTP